MSFVIIVRSALGVTDLRGLDGVRAAGPFVALDAVRARLGEIGVTINLTPLPSREFAAALDTGVVDAVILPGDDPQIAELGDGRVVLDLDGASLPTDGLREVVLDPGGARFREADEAVEVLGGAGSDVVVALSPAGNRVDFSAGGSNRVLTGAGNDTIIAGPGDDVILAGRGGNNRIDLSAGGSNRVFAGDGTDTIIGGAGNDVIRPGRGADLVDLRAGGDNFVANLRGDATILGGAGNDTIRGGIGDTLIFAGGGENRVLGGPGRDVFGFRQESHETRILDFTRGSDRLDFTQHDGVAGLGDLTLRQIGRNTIIDDDSGGRVILADVALEALRDSDFIF